MTNEGENYNELVDVCISCKREVWRNKFTAKWESDHPDFPQVCMPKNWDGVIRERSHQPCRTTSPEDIKVEPQVASMSAWGFRPPPPTAPTEDGEPPPPRRGAGSCGSYSEYFNRRLEVEPEVPTEHREMPFL